MGQCSQVRRLVKALARAAVDPTEAAGGEHLDARPVRQVCRGRDRGRPQRPVHDHARKVADARLDHGSIGRDLIEGAVVQADPDLAAHNRNSCRDGAGLTNCGLDLAGHPGAGLAGQSVADDGGLEGYDTTALAQGGADLFGNDHDEHSTYSSRRRLMSVMVCVAGDVMLDVLVLTQGPLRVDDDTPAAITLGAGGQAANVAAWVRALGGGARLYGPRTRDAVGLVIDGQLMARGISLYAEPQDARCGAVVSLVTSGTRSLASDPGDLEWIDDGLSDPSWLSGADWLHLSGYLLLRAPDPAVVIRASDAARRAGVRVAVDLASASMIETYGPREFWALVEKLGPSVVFGNEGEWDVVGVSPGSLPAEAVVKRGARGSSFVVGGVQTSLDVVPGPVVDVTGAGDALAAGYFVGGPEMAMLAAARCVSQIGAQPLA